MHEPAPSEVFEIAVNLDDVTGELIGHAVAVLIEDGALDVWTTAITMKKQRPGVCLSLLCRRVDRERLAVRVLELTGAFGCRFRLWERLVLERRVQSVRTRYGPLAVKLGLRDGRPVTAKPEFDAAAELAGRQGVPVAAVLDAGRAAARALLADEGGG